MCTFPQRIEHQTKQSDIGNNMQIMCITSHLKLSHIYRITSVYDLPQPGPPLGQVMFDAQIVSKQ